jgi:outer membrane murein-binding lipoprotein Lpp
VDSSIVLLVALVLFVGVWGSMILAAILRRLLPGSKQQPDPRFEDLMSDYRQLESRCERLEEEMDFLRELRQPAGAPKLPGPTPDSGQG